MWIVSSQHHWIYPVVTCHASIWHTTLGKNWYSYYHTSKSSSSLHAAWMQKNRQNKNLPISSFRPWSESGLGITGFFVDTSLTGVDSGLPVTFSNPYIILIRKRMNWKYGILAGNFKNAATCFYTVKWYIGMYFDDTRVNICCSQYAM